MFFPKTHLMFSHPRSFLPSPSMPRCSGHRGATPRLGLAPLAYHPSLFLFPCLPPLFTSCFYLLLSVVHSPHAFTFPLPCDSGCLLGLIGTSAMDDLGNAGKLPIAAEVSTPSTANYQHLWEGWALHSSLTHDGIWHRCGSGTHSCLDCILNICDQPKTFEPMSQGLPKRKPCPHLASMALSSLSSKGQGLQ